MNNLPAWLIKRTPKAKNIKLFRELINDPLIYTVCESAKCPNIGECYGSKTATFMILGNICTRNCGFCAVDHGIPAPPDPTEPKRVAEASKKLGLKYVVITSVTRDDLPDGGAKHFAQTISAITGAKVEVLIPAFRGDIKSLKTVLDANPFILNHNVETVPRLYRSIRPEADYKRSLELIKNAKKIKGNIITKSGFMLGLGEEDKEVEALMLDLKDADCDMITIGQYISPSQNHARVVKYVKPETFEEYKKIGLGIGFKWVFSGPFVRSSYKAHETIK
ncbi:MAG: lipoyl synthase [Candidatus Saganbacteria bacterium]|nr:lipoyl synthase [Candidatus Saganbacteria bacterium]